MKTAVKYLAKEFSAILGPLKTDPMQDLLLVDAIERADKMFEQQILDAFSEGASDGFYGESDSNKEKYYNETFKQDV